MTDRLFACLLLTMFLALQTLSGLHAGSGGPKRIPGHHAGSASNPADETGGLHRRLFGALEYRQGGDRQGYQGASPTRLPADDHPGNNAGNPVGHLSDTNSELICDLIDHLLNAPGCMLAHIDTGIAVAPNPTVRHSVPDRLSKFQRLGPPVRGPPVWSIA